MIRLNYLYKRILGLFLSIESSSMAEELRLVGGLKLEKNGRLKFLCIRAGTWNKENDNSIRKFMEIFRIMGFKVKRMKVSQLWALIGFEEQTIEMDFVGINDVRIR